MKDHNAHHHAHPGHNVQRGLAITLALVVCYMVAEFVGGLLSNSLALLADAGHMLSDGAALALSLFAARIARRPPSPRRTYGYYRAEILAALANGASLVAISLLILVEAIRRFASPPAVQGSTVIAIACGGLVVNLASLLVLRGDRSANLNLRGVWLHVLGDALGSVQAIVAGVLIAAFGWAWADPVASVAITILVVYSAWILLRDSVAVLMESVPGHLDLDEVRRAIQAVPEVQDVHDLHVWSITSGFLSLSAHVTVSPRSSPDVLWRIREGLRERFSISHSTIQVEPEQEPQAIAPAHPSRGERNTGRGSNR